MQNSKQFRVLPMQTTKQRIREQNQYKGHPVMAQRPCLPNTTMTIKYKGDLVLDGYGTHKIN